jgi:hypothetical protein
MSLIPNPGLQPISVEFSPSACLEFVVGIAVFDLNGLPSEYLTTADTSDIDWIQTIFQALGLQSLLVSSLQLEGFNHASVCSTTYCAIVVKQRAHYIAMLISRRETEIINTLIQWAQTTTLADLKQTPRFQKH